MTRGDVTKELSEKVEKKLRRQFALVAQEVWVDPDQQARAGPREGGPPQGYQAEARQGRPLPGAHGAGARRDHGHALRGRGETLSFCR